MTKNSHLGGHFDFTSMFIDELIFLKNKFNVKQMLDIGCGPAGMVEFANHIGIYALGIDGDKNLKEKSYVKYHDFNDGELLLDQKFDLIYSIEFLEHVYEKYIPNYMPLFQKGNNIFVSAAVPGQGGWHHVNEQNKDYWIEIFSQYGFTYQQEVVDSIIDISKNKDFMKKNMMFFVNNNTHTNIIYNDPFIIEDIDNILDKNIKKFIEKGGKI